jgi:NMD protein affecting ribosome stability and mRNA decay
MKEPRKPTDFAQQHGKDDRMYGERLHDPYQARGKYPEPSLCPDCGAVFEKGRWHWGSAGAGAHEQRCPACQRIQDKQPAGVVTLKGDFLSAHRHEIISLIQNAEKKEKPEHPLQRVMAIEDQDGGITVSLTDVHIARAIADALQHAYEGELDYEYSDKDTLFRASWSR